MSRTTKAELILNGARERVKAAQKIADIAEINVTLAKGDLDKAMAVLAAHLDSYDALEKDLARKVKDPKSTAPAVTRRSSQKSGKVEHTVSTKETKESVGTASKVPLCTICGNKKAFDDHQLDSPVYHIFRTEIKKKNKDNGAIVLPGDPTKFEHDSVA